MLVLAHITLAGVLAWWASTGVDPLIVMAVYAFGLVFLNGPKRSA